MICWPFRSSRHPHVESLEMLPLQHADQAPAQAEPVADLREVFEAEGRIRRPGHTYGTFQSQLVDWGRHGLKLKSPDGAVLCQFNRVPASKPHAMWSNGKHLYIDYCDKKGWHHVHDTRTGVSAHGRPLFGCTNQTFTLNGQDVSRDVRVIQRLDAHTVVLEQQHKPHNLFYLASDRAVPETYVMAPLGEPQPNEFIASVESAQEHWLKVVYQRSDSTNNRTSMLRYDKLEKKFVETKLPEGTSGQVYGSCVGLSDGSVLAIKAGHLGEMKHVVHCDAQGRDIQNADLAQALNHKPCLALLPFSQPHNFMLAILEDRSNQAVEWRIVYPSSSSLNHGDYTWHTISLGHMVSEHASNFETAVLHQGRFLEYEETQEHGHAKWVTFDLVMIQSLMHWLSNTPDSPEILIGGANQMINMLKNHMYRPIFESMVRAGVVSREKLQQMHDWVQSDDADFARLCSEALQPAAARA